jgi:hypothetical protein
MQVDNSSVAQDDVVASHFDLVLEADFTREVLEGEGGQWLLVLSFLFFSHRHCPHGRVIYAMLT